MTVANKNDKERQPITPNDLAVEVGNTMNNTRGRLQKHPSNSVAECLAEAPLLGSKVETQENNYHLPMLLIEMTRKDDQPLPMTWQWKWGT